MVKRIICTRLKHVSVYGVESVNENDVLFKDGYSFETILCDNVEFEEKGTDTDDGLLINQALMAKCAISTKKLNTLKVPQVFELTTSAGKTFVTGSPDIAYLCNGASQSGGFAILNFSRSVEDFQL